MFKGKSPEKLLILAEIQESALVARTLAEKYSDISAVLQSTLNSVKPAKVVHTGCGSSYYAASFGAYPLHFSRVSGYSLPASELIYLLSRATREDLGQAPAAVFYSRSGETREVVLALRQARSLGLSTIGLTCSEGSTLHRESDASVALSVCAEKSHYMTKSFIGLSLLGLIFSLLLAEKKAHVVDVKAELMKLSEGVERISSKRENIQELVKTSLSKRNFVVLAPESLYAVALEASLKLVEVSYTFSTALHALEFRHGPLALREHAEDLQLVVLSASSSPSVDYLHRLVDELRHRGFDVLYISDEKGSDLEIPLWMNSQFAYLLHAIAMYYFAVERALLLGYNPDEPRHIDRVVKTV
ncbi:SIS domain-containing protein [Thermofilum sp.]|uniref:SIS domain-containing protein n=1 Tax=Thermofilum sp. TaxID=1961369 RepID=UPI00316182BB